MASFSLPPQTRILATNTATAQGVAFFDWMPAIGVKKVQALVEVKDVSDQQTPTDYRITPAYQVAEVDPDSPGSWTAIDAATYQAGDGRTVTALTDISLGVNDEFWVRFGVLIEHVGVTPAYIQGEITLSVSGTHR